MDSLRLRFPKLASIRAEDGRLSLSFLNLAAQLKFSVAISMSKQLSTSRAAPHSHGWGHSFISLSAHNDAHHPMHVARVSNGGLDKTWICCNAAMSNERHLKGGNSCAGTLMLQDGELACSAKVHFPGNTGLQAAAVEAAVQGTPCGHGRLLLACGRLAELAEAKTGSAAALSGSAATAGACNSEAADETAPLNVFSNPLYTCATPKHVC